MSAREFLRTFRENKLMRLFSGIENEYEVLINDCLNLNVTESFLKP